MEQMRSSNQVRSSNKHRILILILRRNEPQCILDLLLCNRIRPAPLFKAVPEKRSSRERTSPDLNFPKLGEKRFKLFVRKELVFAVVC